MGNFSYIARISHEGFSRNGKIAGKGKGLLSDSYIAKTADPMLELKVKVINKKDQE